jgi:hypothetical protein
MSNKQIPERRAEIILHKPGWKTLLRCVVIASTISDALSIVRLCYPNDKITSEDVIHFKVYPIPEQLTIFS